jgi:predicted transcriptional regulator
MEIGAVTSNAGMAMAVRLLETTNAIQTEMIKQRAGSQQQLAAMLQAQGLGQTVPIMTDIYRNF